MERSPGREILYGTRQTADYVPSAIKAYQGNPLIEALPPILEADDVVSLLERRPDYDAGERQMPSMQRVHAAHSQLLEFFFQPLPVHCDLESRLSRLIRQGYISRNPLGIDRIKQLNHIRKQLQQVGQYELPRDLAHSANSFSIIGPSGVGKTTGVERILQLYPQLIIHEEPSLYQIVWLKLDCPFDGSLGGLCRRFFQAVDEILGTNYRVKFAGNRMPLDAMIHHMAQLAALHCIGVLVIDEIQHLSMAKSGGADKMLNFFVTVINTIGIPVVLIGTMAALPILQNDFRQARRGTGVGCLNWESMQEDEQWHIMLENMWQYQWTQEPFALTEELARQFYEESQGIMDVAVKLFLLAQIRAISHQLETVTPTLVTETVEEHFRLMQPMLKALRSGNPFEISKYPDMRPVDIESCIEKYRHSILEPVKKTSTGKTKVDWDSKAYKALTDRGYAPDACKEKITNALPEKAKHTAFESWLKEIVKGLGPIKKGGSTSRTQRKGAMDEASLVALCRQAPEKEAYAVLKEKGFIKDPAADFTW